jgi:serine/threonine protein phosphatase PrpC
MTNWLLMGASVRGHAHVADGRPGQDASRLGWFDGFGLGIVCDGAGSAEHADEGARQTALLCEHHFGRLLAETGWAAQDEPPSAAVWHDEAKATLREVRADLEKIAGSQERSPESLACTVIVAIFTDNWLLLTHIGDGRAGYCRWSDTDLTAADRPNPVGDDWEAGIIPLHGAEANETVFLTSDIWQPDRIDQFVESRVVAGPLRALCLLSDGCEKASFECNLYDPAQQRYSDPNRPFAPFFDPVALQVLTLYESGRSRADVDALWADFLHTGTDRFRTEPDDKTLLLAVHGPRQQALNQPLVTDDQRSTDG